MNSRACRNRPGRDAVEVDRRSASDDEQCDPDDENRIGQTVYGPDPIPSTCESPALPCPFSAGCPLHRRAARPHHDAATALQPEGAGGAAGPAVTRRQLNSDS